MAKEINVHLKATGAPEAKQALEQTGQAAGKLGDEARDSGQKVSAAGTQQEQALGRVRQAHEQTSISGKALSGITQQLSGALLGLASISGVVALFKQFAEHLEAVAAAQQKIVASSKGFTDATKALAGQAGVMGTQAGLDAAAAQVRQIMALGNLSDYGIASDIAVATHSAFGTPGQLLTEGQMGIGGVVGDFAQRKNISGDASNQLLKLLATAGVNDEAGAQQRIQQLSTVQQASKAKNFEEFISSAIKSMVPAMAQGSSFEFAASQFASAMDVSAGGDLAAETTKQAAALLQNPDAVKALAARSGVGANQFRDLPYQQRMETLGQWVADEAASGAGQKRLLAAGISPDQLGRMQPLFKPQQIERTKMFQGLAAGATGAQFKAEQTGFKASNIGQVETIGANTAINQALVSDDIKLGDKIREGAEAAWVDYVAHGQETFMYPDSVEKPEQMIWLPMMRRLNRLRQLPNLTDAQREEIDDLRAKLRDNPVGVLNPFTPEEIGQFESAIGKQEQKYLGSAQPLVINYNNGVTYSYGRGESTPASPPPP